MTIRDIVMAAAGVGGAPPPASSTDPQFNYVTMLLHGDGTNGAQNNTFVDSSTNNFTITRNGTPTQGSFSPYGTLWSNLFNGSSDWVRFSYSSSLIPASGTDFTAECWVYLTGSTAAFQFILGMNNRFVADWQIVNENGQWNAYLSGASANLGAVIANQWVHLAVVRSGSRVYGYLNGTRAFDLAASTQSNNGLPLHIGARSGTDRYFPGYISNVRIVSNAALYTGASFTPSTTPLTAVSGTSLLACQSNRFIDNSSNNFAITVTGTPSVQRFSPFEPAAEYSTSVIGGSGYFSGSSQYLSATSNSSLDISTGDFTVEFFINPASITTGIVVGFTDGAFISSATQLAFAIYFSGSSLIVRVYYGASFSAIATVSVPVSAWTHIALVRSGNVFTVYRNGVSAGTATLAITLNYGSGWKVGVGSFVGDSQNGYLNGYLSNLRLVKGTAVYTANFTPPTAPLTAIANTSLLLNTVNAGIYDNAMMNDLVTVGDAKVSTAVAKYGTGSLAFDGTGDWLTFVDSPNVQLGSGDFTIEGWVNLSALGSARGIFSKGTATTGLSLAVNALNQVVFNYTASSLTGTTVLMATTWYHIAVVRSGSATGNVKIFINGTADATSGGAITDNFNQTNAGYIGADRVGTSPMNGYIDDLRITKGYARYTANFTPPTAALPNN